MCVCVGGGGVCVCVYILVNVYIVNNISKLIHIKKCFQKIVYSFTETYFLTNENPFRYAGTQM